MTMANMFMRRSGTICSIIRWNRSAGPFRQIPIAAWICERNESSPPVSRDANVPVNWQRIVLNHIFVKAAGLQTETLYKAGMFTQVGQQSLFDEEHDERDTKLDQVADQIRNRFGTASLRRASTVQHNAEHQPLPRPE